ncbi:hypothetical protein IGI04_027218, partial [Brassica rapa subsp. trilocularis]
FQPIIIDNVHLCCYGCSNSVSSSTFDDLCLGLTSQVVVGQIHRFWDSRNIKKNVEFIGVKPRLMESKIETLNLTLIEERLKLSCSFYLCILSRKRAVTTTEQVNRLVSPDRGRSKNAALPSTSQETCGRLDVEGMDHLGNSLQVVIDTLLLITAKGQAGKYTAVYQKLAQKHPSFRDNAHLIVVISLKPWLPFIPDTVISGILIPLPAFGVLSVMFVGDSLKILRQEVEEHAKVLGFVGAPWKLSGQLTPVMWEPWSKTYIKEKRCSVTPFVFYIKWKHGSSSADVIGLDWTVDMADGKRRLGSSVRDLRVHGNGIYSNQGHGVLVGTSEEALAHFFETARSLAYEFCVYES